MDYELIKIIATALGSGTAAGGLLYTIHKFYLTFINRHNNIEVIIRKDDFEMTVKGLAPKEARFFVNKFVRKSSNNSKKIAYRR
jgi:outer membrane lipoprotein SlyB